MVCVWRIGPGWVARIIDRAISSFLWGRFVVVLVFWMSFESCWRSCVLPYSYIWVVDCLVFCFLGLYVPFGWMVPRYFAVFWGFLVCLFHLLVML